MRGTSIFCGMFLALLCIAGATEVTIQSNNHCLSTIGDPSENGQVGLTLSNGFYTRSQIWEVEWDKLVLSGGAITAGNQKQGLRIQVLDENVNDGNIATWGYGGTGWLNQKWVVQVQQKQTYLVQNIRTGRCMSHVGSKLVTQICDPTLSEQLWIIQASKTIKGVGSGNYLTMDEITPPANIRTEPWNSGPSQAWDYHWAIAFGAGSKFIPGIKSTTILALDEDVKTNKVVGWNSWGGDNQHWYFKSITYSEKVQIINRQTNRCLTDKGLSQPIITSVCNENDAFQTWIVNIVRTPPQKQWHNSTLKYEDDDVAIYFDDVMPQHYTWMFKFFGDAWRYTKTLYGSMGSDEKLYYFCSGPADFATISYWSSDSSNYPRNIVYMPSWDWSWEGAGWNRDTPLHEIAHIVESVTNGKLWSPSFGLWGDSAWALIFQLDLYLHLDLPSPDIVNHFLSWVLNSGTSPSPSGIGSLNWLKDWWLPIYNNHGKSQLLQRYFQLLSVHWPQKGNAYKGGINFGEFIHFWSGAAGVNLKRRAEIAFGWSPEVEDMFQKAKTKYNNIVYLEEAKVEYVFSY